MSERLDQHNAYAADDGAANDGVYDDAYDTTACGVTNEADQTELDLELQFLDFLAQSAAHRKERDAKKRLADKKRQTGNYAMAPNPTEAPGVARRRQYKLLYGSDLDSVQMLEARLNLAHDQSIDARGPKLWPALPLKM
jgi:hypothetical protein